MLESSSSSSSAWPFVPGVAVTPVGPVVVPAVGPGIVPPLAPVVVPPVTPVVGPLVVPSIVPMPIPPVAIPLAALKSENNTMQQMNDAVNTTQLGATWAGRYGGE